VPVERRDREEGSRGIALTPSPADRARRRAGVDHGNQSDLVLIRRPPSGVDLGHRQSAGVASLDCPATVLSLRRCEFEDTLNGIHLGEEGMIRIGSPQRGTCVAY